MTIPVRSAIQPTPPPPLRAVPLIGILLLASLIYSWLIGWRTTDVEWWFVPWLDYIIQHGAKASLEAPLQVQIEGVNGFANYSPPYLYLLVLASKASAWLPSFLLVKLVSVAGAMFCAGCIYYLIRALAPASVALLGAAGLFLVPSVALNGPAWGQTDMIWSALAALVVAFALRQRWAAMMLAFGAAVAFKLQAVFVAPFLLYMVLSYRISPRYFLLPVLAYAAMMLPAWLAGRPAWGLATVYLEQAGAYRWLSLNAPNPWSFVQYTRLISYETGVLLGTAAAVLTALSLGALSVRWRRLHGGDLLLLAVTVAAAMPYVLPKMHERYFFLADILAYALAISRPRPWTIFVAVAIQLGSVCAYASHMLDFTMGKYLGALLIGAALIVLLHRLWLTLRPAHTGIAASPSAMA
jgi:Gpi18-like mannosyltransferase